ncbi:Iron(3+)-hydroxamate import ATP-binding protein FhuC [Anoxybacillus thermarum]|uniref:Iron(3+)-hydroxamate import ATP-binding protein FhuC n=1 Tax=Anoxybacillus thermarum TaxID=404937 RepID=A0A0D0S0Z7_9BACL|nr:adenosylcobinamide amidohydrolase [Anoxybacillus thermarum]KIQ94641.1 Iron(3+)-hydroxamate import ATP-binding protein FhuC [Anoxybacillus thermarum]
MIDVKNVSYRYDEKQVLRHVSFTVYEGEFFGILGPNGSGKTTLIKLLSRELALQQGDIFVCGQHIETYKPKQYAKLIATLPQHTDVSFGYTVKEMVELGRYPYQSNLFPKWTKEDEQVVSDSLHAVTLAHKQHALLEQLSGGERQRAALARALAQQPCVLLLDEPTNHMDVAQQFKLLNLLKQSKLTIVAIFHDINIASLYCDRLLFLRDGKAVACGTPKELLNESMIASVFETNMKRYEHPVLPKPLVTFVPFLEEPMNDVLWHVNQNETMVVIETVKPFKVLSSALVGGGTRWATTFVNRHVPLDYRCDDAKQEMIQFLRQHGFDEQWTVGMMTAVCVNDVAFASVHEDVRLFVAVTAGVGNAVDSAQAWRRTDIIASPGTINTFIFIDAHLSEAAFVQALMTATEAKAKALYDKQVIDPQTYTIATGTSTDSTVIAASQQGTYYEYAGTITSIGKQIARLVYEATQTAIDRYRKRKGDIR